MAASVLLCRGVWGVGTLRNSAGVGWEGYGNPCMLIRVWTASFSQGVLAILEEVHLLLEE